jgi:MFS family permease
VNNYRHVRRNFAMFFIDYAFFGTAFGLIGHTTVVPDFLSRLTTSQPLIGLVGSLYLFIWLLPQLFMAQVINKAKRRKPFMTYTVIPFRLLMALMALGIAVTPGEARTTLLIIFMSGYLVFALGDGLVTLVWADMLGSMVPHRWRGLLFSVAQIVVALGALASRELVRRVLDGGAALGNSAWSFAASNGQEVVRGWFGNAGLTFPQNYAVIFGVAAAMFFVAGVALTLLVEEAPSPSSQTSPTLRQFFPYLGNVLRTDGPFRQFVLVRLLMDFSTMATTFYILFGTDLIAAAMNVPRERIAGEVIGNSILLSTAGSASGALLMSWASHRSGSRAVLILGGLGACLHPFLALLALSGSQVAYYGIFFALGFVTAATVPGYFDWIITYAPADRRPIYVGLTNTISAISHLAPAVGGVLLSLTSYPVLFGASLLMGILSVVSIYFLPEPRQKAADEVLITEPLAEPHG